MNPASTTLPSAANTVSLSRLPLNWLAGGWLAAMMVMLFILLTREPHIFHIDVAYHLTLGERVLSGQRHYIDFEDVNLPMINYLSAIPVAAAPILSINILTAFNGMLLLMILGTLALSYWVARGLLPAWQISVLLAALMTGLNLHVLAFGEREYFFVVFTVPWFLLRWRRIQGASVPAVGAVALGLLAGTGTVIKPFFLAPLLLPELYIMSQLIRRGWRNLLHPEWLGMGIIGACFAAFFLINMDSLQALLLLWQRTQPGYVAYGYISVERMIIEAPAAVYLLLVPLSVMAITGAESTRLHLLRVLLLVSVGGFIALAVQTKGFAYHHVPLHAFLAMSMGAAFLVMVNALQHEPVMQHIRALLLGVAVASVLMLGRLMTPPPTANSLLNLFTQQITQPGDVILSYAEMDMHEIAVTNSLRQRQFYVFSAPLRWQTSPAYAQSQLGQGHVADYYERVQRELTTMETSALIVAGLPRDTFKTLQYYEDLILPRYMLYHTSSADLFDYVGDAPPRDDRYRFDDTLNLISWDYDAEAMQACGRVPVNTWWQLTGTPDGSAAGYRMVVQVYNAATDELVTTAQMPPAQQDISRWTRGALYASTTQVTVPCDDPDRTYRVALSLMKGTDPSPVSISRNGQPIGQMTINLDV